jgi:hypothetical protein
MNRQNLKSFASQNGVSEKTLKRKFGDCIYRNGRQSFIDVDAFDKVFAERSLRGRRTPRKITESTSIRRIQMTIPKAQVKLAKIDITIASLEKGVKETPEGQSRKIAENELRRVKKVQHDQKTLIEKLLARVDELIDGEDQKWAALDKASVVGASPREQ